MPKNLIEETHAQARGLFGSLPSGELRRQSVVGGAVTVFSQLAKLVLQTLSTIVMARLLAPEQFGLVGMVMAVTGVFVIIRDAGLSTATVRSEVISHEQVSTLFWINSGLGFALALLAALLAPLIAAFYHEPRLVMVTIALASTSIFSGISAQHQALLQRQMRFPVLAVIEIISLSTGIAVGVVMGLRGFGLWALVGMQIAQCFVSCVATLVALPWVPGPPRIASDMKSMLRFSGFLTGSNLMAYMFRNTDNVLIGWYWGAGPLGLYSKAYGLLMLPITQVNSPISGVAVPALSRVQSDPERFRRYFLGGYSIAASVVLPIVMALFIFADEVIYVMLGPKWTPAVHLFRLLAPAAISGALLNPFGWIFMSMGRTDRQFRFAILWSCLVICAFAAGLPFGPEGVAAGYSLMSCLLGLPLCFYAVKGTTISVRDLFQAILPPLVGVLIAAICGLALKFGPLASAPAAMRGIAGCAAVLAVYSFVLLVVMRRWSFYRELLKQLLPARFANGLV